MNNFELKIEQVDGSLINKVAELKEIYTTLVELELELKAIRNEGNIIAYEKKAKVLDNGTLSEERVGKFKDEIENKLGARTLGARSRGSKNVTYRQQTTDKKVNTEPL